MIVMLRDDPLNSLPSLLTCGQDGSLNSWNLDKNVAEFQVSKAHEGGYVVDMVFNPEKKIITSIGSDRWAVNVEDVYCLELLS